MAAGIIAKDNRWLGRGVKEGLRHPFVPAHDQLKEVFASRCW